MSKLFSKSVHVKKLFLRIKTYWYIPTVLFLVILIFVMWGVSLDATERYQSLLSAVVYDRSETVLSVKENIKGHYAIEVNEMPNAFIKLLIKKEDSYFYYHPGINPVSTLRALYTHIIEGTSNGASTITQQLTKNLLGTESQRTLWNKSREAFYALSMELFTTKDEILVMYANTVYLGNQTQGFEAASYAYFNNPFADTTYSEQISLLATLSYPSARNPWQKDNTIFAESLSKRITPNTVFIPPQVTNQYSFQRDSYFELRTAGIQCVTTCHTTTDDAVTQTIRTILARHIDSEWRRGARNGAVVVIDPKSSEIIALVGSKDPENSTSGNQINMTIMPRPIGSTVKPFIYVKGFTEGLRPYTLVDDREYKYQIATGFPLYPKNYDGQYRGEVTLHEALSNSLNVPSVKVLEYIGLDNFYAFLSEKLKFTPIQDYDSYQYGIALGGLEMDLLTLTHYFTIFPRGGTIEPIHVLRDTSENFELPPQSTITEKTVIADEAFTELVHTVISDRLTGVNQFGLESNLNIETNNYGVKTGTSRDFHDSWVVGYTGDFVVGVWLGNTENEPLEQISGQSGAGAIWHDVMDYLITTSYNKKTTIKMDAVTRFHINDSDEWGLSEDVVAEHRDILESNVLILSPYNKDSFEFFNGITIPLKSRKVALWTANGTSLGTAKELHFKPDTPGTYELTAYDETTDRREILTIYITEKE